jgi:hypothetical protein
LITGKFGWHVRLKSGFGDVCALCEFFLEASDFKSEFLLWKEWKEAPNHVNIFNHSEVSEAKRATAHAFAPSRKSLNADIAPRRFNVAEVPQADLTPIKPARSPQSAVCRR